MFFRNDHNPILRILQFKHCYYIVFHELCCNRHANQIRKFRRANSNILFNLYYSKLI